MRLCPPLLCCGTDNIVFDVKCVRPGSEEIQSENGIISLPASTEDRGGDEDADVPCHTYVWMQWGHTLTLYQPVLFLKLDPFHLNIV